MSSDLEKAIKGASDLLEVVELFDIYVGEQVDSGKKSLAWHLAFRDQKKTLSSEDADKELAKIIKALEGEFKARVRK